MKFFVFICFAWLLALPASAQDLRRIVSGEASSTALTIYPKNLALITETRMIDLPVGKSTIVFEGVNDRMIPASVLLREFSGLTIERNFDAALLGKANLFKRSVGETVTLTRTDKSSGIVRQVRAKIVSAGGGVVFDIGGKLETFQCSGLSETTGFENLPEGLNGRPELSIDVNTTNAGPRELVISYLADGFSWAADYRLDLTGEENAKFLAWLTFKNESAQTFKDVQPSVVAGRLQVEAETKSKDGLKQLAISQRGGTTRQVTRRVRRRLVSNCWPYGSTLSAQHSNAGRRREGFAGYETVTETVVVQNASAKIGENFEQRMVGLSDYAGGAPPPPPEEEDLSEYKLYRIPEPITVASYQTKQIRFIDNPDVKYKSVYTFEKSWNSLLNPEAWLEAAILETRLDNSKDGNLAKALPSGNYRVMGRTDAGRATILGVDYIENRAVDLPVKIKTNLSHNVQMQTSVIDNHLRKISGLYSKKNQPLSIEHTFYNAHVKPVTVEFRARPQPNFQWKNTNDNGISRSGMVMNGYRGEVYNITEASIKMDEDEAQPTWTFTVPANGTKTLTYKAEAPD